VFSLGADAIGPSYAREGTLDAPFTVRRTFLLRGRRREPGSEWPSILSIKKGKGRCASRREEYVLFSWGGGEQSDDARYAVELRTRSSSPKGETWWPSLGKEGGRQSFPQFARSKKEEAIHEIGAGRAHGEGERKEKGKVPRHAARTGAGDRAEKEKKLLDVRSKSGRRTSRKKKRECRSHPSRPSQQEKKTPENGFPPPTQEKRKRESTAQSGDLTKRRENAANQRGKRMSRRPGGGKAENMRRPPCDPQGSPETSSYGVEGLRLPERRRWRKGRPGGGGAEHIGISSC